MKRFLVFALCIMMALSFASCKKDTDVDAPKNSASAGSDSTSVNEAAIPDIITGEMVIKDYGVLAIELYPKLAPQSVYNFVYLANEGFYNGIIFHRIAKDFCIQAGRFETGFVERAVPGGKYSIKGEFAENGFENPLTHAKGILSWARLTAGEDPFNSASTEFFICLDTANSRALNGSYAPFGKVVGGLDVINAISQVECVGETPASEVLITLVTINGATLPKPDFIRPTAEG